MSIKFLSVRYKEQLPLFLVISIFIHFGIFLAIPQIRIEKKVLPRLIPVEIIEVPQQAKAAEKRPKVVGRESIEKRKALPVESEPRVPKETVETNGVKESLSAESKLLSEEKAVDLLNRNLTGSKDEAQAVPPLTEEKPLRLYPSEERITELTKEYEKQTPLSEKNKSLSFDTSEPRYISYFETLKGMIYHKWEYPQAAVREGQAGRLFIRFSILKNGKLEEAILIKSSGYPMLDDAALSAIRLAAPYYPFPKDFGSVERITVNASFEYMLIPSIER